MFNVEDLDTPDGVNAAKEKLTQWTEKQQQLKSDIAVAESNLKQSEKELKDLGIKDISNVEGLLEEEITKRNDQVNKINDLIASAKE